MVRVSGPVGSALGRLEKHRLGTCRTLTKIQEAHGKLQAPKDGMRA